MFLQNVPAKVIQDILGHSTIQMTMDTYSHLMLGMGRDAANSLDRFLS
jgi:integrase